MVRTLSPRKCTVGGREPRYPQAVHDMTGEVGEQMDDFAKREALWVNAAAPEDLLLQFPSPNETYVSRKGEFTIADGRFYTEPHGPQGPGDRHPVLLRARRLGTYTRRMGMYWVWLTPNINMPLAGTSAKHRHEAQLAAQLEAQLESLENVQAKKTTGKKKGSLQAAAAPTGITRQTRSSAVVTAPLPAGGTSSTASASGSAPSSSSTGTSVSSPLSTPKAAPQSQSPSNGEIAAGCNFNDFQLEIGQSSEENFHNRPSIKIPVPDHIKSMLVDDWENVTKNQQLVPLPHVHPVEEILDDYLAFERPHREDGSASLEILEETISGLRNYFDRCLGRILLYRFERAQYYDLHQQWNSGSDCKHKSAVDTYGAEHLARLLVSLPELIAQTNMDQQSVNRLREELTKFSNWFGRQAAKYFVSEYETPGQEYIEQARSV